MKKFNVTITSASQIAAVNFLSDSLKKGCAVKVTSYKETKMNKGTQANRNPYLGRVFERTTIGGWQVGTSYVNSCQNAAVKSGSTETFISRPSWHIYFNDFFEVDKATETKYYLQLQKSAQSGNKTEKTYYVDGHEATEAEVEDIQKWLPKSEKKQSSSQTEAGIDADRERSYILLGLENIESIEQGEFTYRVCKE